MSSHPPPRPADLDVVRDSYDRVADNYVDMVATTRLGDIRRQPWLRAAMDVLPTRSAGWDRSSTSGAGPAP
jgi:hypothetical protein